ncbi:MAG: hypothetical protein HOP30_08445 [Cyclobacteriaceae bacterium]|nr:hypothetical protein [Cyclobacteriaceae bacterium]
MLKLKKAFRFVGLVLLILLACTGIFAGAIFLPRNREPQLKKENTIEMMAQKKDQEEPD